jgi:crotonobetainyl-CoA:carnitine CoA-transferase CaiB-like acyl-CoA transferase
VDAAGRRERGPTYYLAINRNKRSVALDLKDDGDRALAQELARRADRWRTRSTPDDGGHR